MKYIFKYLLLVCLAAGLFSCNKLLEIPSHPDDKLSDDRVYSDSINVMGALVGLYANIKVGGSGGTIFSVELNRSMGYYSDEVYPTGVGGNADEFLMNEVQVTNGGPSTYWTSCYTGIYQANALLQGITDNTKISPTLQQRAKGEALVVRALYYFHLVNLFGPVPYVISTDYKINAKLPRSSVDSVYGLIISDLTTAIDLLSTTYPSAGRARPNQYVARAFLAKVYLYRKEWKKAADMASTVIGNPVYQLSDLAKMFQDGSTEAIWQVPSVANYGQVADVNYFVPYYPTDMPTVALTDYQMNAFEPNDQRKIAWTGTSVVNNVTYYYSYKYKNRDISTTPKEFLMFFRLTEQHFIRAEANAQQGLLDTARADLNRIRGRAGLGVTPAVTKGEVLLAIEHERQTEMFCELAQRWFDLKRTGRANDVLKNIKAKWNPSDTLLPVPVGEMRNNPFLTQNDGYK